MILYLGMANQMHARAYHQARSRLTSSPGYTRSEPRPSLHRFEPRSFAPHRGRASDLTQFTVFCRPSPKQKSTSFCQRISLRSEGRLFPSTTACSNARDLVPRRGGLPSSTARHNKALGTRAKDTTRTGQSPEIKKGLRHRAVHYFDACTSHQTTLKQKLRYHLQTLDPLPERVRGVYPTTAESLRPKAFEFLLPPLRRFKTVGDNFWARRLGRLGRAATYNPGRKGTSRTAYRLSAKFFSIRRSIRHSPPKKL